MKFLSRLQVLSSRFFIPSHSISLCNRRVLRLVALSSIVVTGCTQAPQSVSETPAAETSPISAQNQSVSPDESAATSSTTSGNTTVEKKSAGKQAAGKGINWRASMEEAMAEARKTNRPVMVDFHATWCGPCHMMNDQTWTNAEVIKQSKNWITVKVDVDKRPDLQAAYGATGLPTVAFLNPDGKPVTGFQGFHDGRETAEFMKEALPEVKRAAKSQDGSQDKSNSANS